MIILYDFFTTYVIKQQQWIASHVTTALPAWSVC